MINFKTLSSTLTLIHKRTIIQDSKRLKTFNLPQEKQIPQIPKDIFDEVLLLGLIKLQTGFEKLKQQQPDEKEDKIAEIRLLGLNRLEVQSSKGWFIFEGRQELSTLFYTSPFSGVYNQKRWKSNKDEHLMEENVSRQIQGKFYSYLQL